MSETFRTVLIAAVALSAGFTWQAIRTAGIPVSSPERLVGELRLAQIAALLLATTAGAYIGFSVAQANQPGAGMDVVLAVGFFLAAATTLVREPRQALTILAAAFAAHAVVDLVHWPSSGADGVVPHWYAVGCAVFNLQMAALAYLPVFRR